MKLLRDLSIKHKLVLILVLTSGVSLAIASAAFVGYDVASYKRSFVRELEAQAHIIAYNSAAALTFDDYDSAAETIGALRKESRVVGAYLLSPEGQVFAQYERGDVQGQFPRPRIAEDGAFFIDDRLVVSKPVAFDGETIGHVYIEADLRDLEERVRGYVGLATSIVASVLLVVFFLSSRLQRLISEPILRLATTARRISRQKDYALRATKYGEDEVGALIDGFNEMLAEIQARDGELEQHRDRLEDAVVRRTAELREVNDRLRDSEETLRTIVEGTSSTTGAEYFDALVTTLARAFGTRWVMVGALEGDDRVRVQALWDGERVVRDMCYPLKGTPCAEAVTESFCLYEDRVSELFPRDRMLSEWSVRSYVGVVLRDSSGVAVGILNAFHDGPLSEAAREGSMLRVFASRAAAELERLRVEAELLESESRTRAILESAADGIVTVDEEGIVESVNRAAEQMFGRPSAEVVGNHIAALMCFPNDDLRQQRLLEVAGAVLGDFVDTRGEISGLRVDGTAFPMNVAVGKMRVGGSTGFTAIVRDITRERELERMKSDFVSTVSHEIRTPLAAIISSAKILMRNGEARPAVTSKFSSIIVEEGKRLTRLINDLLDLSKMDAGKIEWTVKEANPAELIRHVMAVAEGDLIAKKLTSEVQVENDIPPVHVDRDKLVQVLTNLVNNAIKFTPPGGRIEVSAHARESGFVCVAVKDTGIGIADEHQASIFERFKQIGDVLTDRPQGTGLGLPICKQIVEYLGGKIWVESEPGKGATFWFTVPVADAHLQSAEGVDTRDLEEEFSVRAYALAEERIATEAASDRPLAEKPIEPAPAIVPGDADSSPATVEATVADERFDAQVVTADQPATSEPIVAESAADAPPVEASVADEPIAEPPFADEPMAAAGSDSGFHPGPEDDEGTGEPVPADEPPLAAAPGAPCILVVEDDPATSEILRYTFEQRNFRVVVAARADEAIRLVGELRPALVTLDIVMPGGSGFDVLRAIRADDSLADIPVVLLSVLADEARNDQGLKLGANAYLPKPFDPKALLATAEKLVSESRRDVLIISEDIPESHALKTSLSGQGFRVVEALDADSGLTFARRYPPDLILLQAAASNVETSAILDTLRSDRVTERIPVVLIAGDAIEDSKAVYLGGWSESRRSDTATLNELLSSLVEHYAARGRTVVSDHPPSSTT